MQIRTKGIYKYKWGQYIINGTHPTSLSPKRFHKTDPIAFVYMYFKYDISMKMTFVAPLYYVTFQSTTHPNLKKIILILTH